MGQIQSAYYNSLPSWKWPAAFIQRLLHGSHYTATLSHVACGVFKAIPTPKPSPPIKDVRLTLQSLPVEVLLHVFSFLELKPYIISYGVCKRWKHLLPLASIHPIRLRLFNLYQDMLNSSYFLLSREWIVENLHPFDRRAYINDLIAQYPAIPEEFRIWILEWPDRRVVGSAWPGLPFMKCYKFDGIRRDGVNWLGYKSLSDSPVLHAALYRDTYTEQYRFIPCLIAWRDCSNTDYLLFDQETPDLFGKVYCADQDDYYFGSGEIPHPPPHIDEYVEAHYNDTTSFPDWICYLEHYWNALTPKFLLSGHKQTSYPPDRPVPVPVLFEFNNLWSCRHPVPLWNERDQHIECLALNH